MSKYIVTIAVLLVSLPVFVQAGPIIRSGETISIDATQVLQGDFYGLASTISISGSAENDLYVAGGTVTINAPVAHDLSVIGGVVQIHGEVGDDLRVIGGEVVIAEDVLGDVAVLGGTVTILSTAVVHGDVLVLAGDVHIAGDVKGTVHGTSDTARIDALVGGDISYSAKYSLVLGNKAKVGGNINYDSPIDLVRAQDAQVAGDIYKKNLPVENSAPFSKWYVLQGCMLLFVALSFYLIGAKYVQPVVEHMFHSMGISGLIGLGAFFIIPFVSGVLLVSIVGSLLAIFLFIFYLLTLITALVLAGMFLGYALYRIVFKKPELSFMNVVVGVVVLLIFGLVPVIGGLVIIASTLVALGGIYRALYQKLRSA